MNKESETTLFGERGTRANSLSACGLAHPQPPPKITHPLSFTPLHQLSRLLNLLIIVLFTDYILIKFNQAGYIQ